MKALGIVVAVLLLLVVAFAMFFLKISIYKQVVGVSEVAYREKMLPAYADALAWFDSLRTQQKVEDRYFTNEEGLRLHAYFIPCENAVGNVVLAHGYSGCAIQTAPHAKMYFEKFHYNVVMVDHRAHAGSEGKVINMGWKERLDVLRWVELANEAFGNGLLPMTLHGLSMGGACVLMCAEHGLPSYVKALVDDSGFSSAYEEFAYEMRTKMHLPPFPLLDAASLLCKIKEGWSFKEASSIRTLGAVKTPLLIIHGNADTRVPLTEGVKIMTAKKEQVDFWEVEEGTHIQAISQQPELYEETLSSFLRKANTSEV